jgi:murein DD-endopeptidase MepM/ murein hydrolase activator NlpD
VARDGVTDIWIRRRIESATNCERRTEKRIIDRSPVKIPDSPNTMTRRRALLLALATPAAAEAAAPDRRLLVDWTPLSVFVGAPILFKTTASSGPAAWLDKNIEFRPAGDGSFSALAGVGLDRAPGNYPLVFNGQTIEIAVKAHFYPSSTIKVPPKFVQPPKEVQARIDEEVALKRAVFKSSPPERLWQGAFTPPAKTRYTSSFGVRRIYNGSTQSTHHGLDYSAPIGTEIKASNSGRAAIVRDMYFEGGLIVIDHGESIFTLYMHLSEFLVKEGAAVQRGQIIARSGSSGRATGPHLHFAVQWQGSYLEPATLLHLWT